MFEGMQAHDFVMNLPPLDPPQMSRDELNGCAEPPMRIVRQVGTCRDCGADVPIEQWYARGKRCARC